VGQKEIVNNRRARHDYFVEDSYEAGIVLQGTEVKSLRATNGITLKDSYADIRGGEMYLVGAHIQPYAQGNIMNHEPERARKLLMHRAEIEKIAQRTGEKGFTLVPLRVYFKDGKVKVEIGLCRGKNTYDKRDSLKEREAKRDVDRALRSMQKG
jgi:SsrA-binding protein